MIKDEVDRLIRRRFHVRNDPGRGYPLICHRGGRVRLASIFAELQYANGVEIGTREGIFARQLVDANPNLMLTCVDPWEAYSQATQEQQEELYLKAQGRIAGTGATILRNNSMEALALVPDGLDFVYIDGDHDFDAVMCDIIFWSRKVRTGGIMAGHDYFACPSVARAVDAYAMNHGDVAPWYVVREDARTGRGGTWFWVVG